MSISSFTNVDSANNNLIVDVPSRNFRGSELLDFEVIASKRKTLDEKASLVTSEFLNKTRADIHNVEHAQILVEILQKQPQKRFNEELLFLKEAFSDVKFFEKMESELEHDDLIKLFKQLQFKEHRRGEIVFNYNDWGEEFFIIIRGAVFILLNVLTTAESKVLLDEKDPNSNEDLEFFHQIEEDENESIDSPLFPNKLPPEGESKRDSKLHVQIDESLTANKRKSTFNLIVQKGRHSTQSLLNQEAPQRKRRMTMLSKHDSEEEQVKALERAFPNFFVGKTMKQGESFGDIALQHRTRRTATVVCKEKTLFGVLSKRDFDSLLSKVYKKQDEQAKSFLKNINIFAGLSDYELKTIYLQLQQREFNKNYIIYKQGQTPDFIYFVREGEVELSTEVDVTETKSVIREIGPETKQAPTKNKLLRTQKKDKKRFRVEQLGAGHCFGFEEFFEQKARKTTVVVSSVKVSLFAISIARFSKIVRDQEVLHRLLTEINRFDQRIKNLVSQNERHEIKMAIAISELTRQQKKETMKHELETIAKVSENFREEHETRNDTPKSKTGVAVQLPTKNENKISNATTLAPIENSSDKKLTRQPSALMPLKSTSEKDFQRDELTNSSLYKTIRKVDLLEEYEMNENIKFKPYFINNNQTNEYVNKKVRVFNQINGTQENNAHINKKSAGQLDLDFLSAISPKGGTYSIQKRALDIKFKREFTRYMNPNASTIKPSDNSISHTSKENYYRLCKSLRIDKIMSDSKDQLNSFLDDTERNNLTERFQALNPELSSVLKSLTKEIEETETGKALTGEKKKEGNSVRLPPINKEKNIHVEKAKKIIVKTAQPSQISPTKAYDLNKVLEHHTQTHNNSVMDGCKGLNRVISFPERKMDNYDAINQIYDHEHYKL